MRWCWERNRERDKEKAIWKKGKKKCSHYWLVFFFSFSYLSTTLLFAILLSTTCAAEKIYLGLQLPLPLCCLQFTPSFLLSLFLSPSLPLCLSPCLCGIAPEELCVKAGERCNRQWSAVIGGERWSENTFLNMHKSSHGVNLNAGERSWNVLLTLHAFGYH